jgi:hypothetical protein
MLLLGVKAVNANGMRQPEHALIGGRQWEGNGAFDTDTTGDWYANGEALH